MRTSATVIFFFSDFLPPLGPTFRPRKISVAMRDGLLMSIAIVPDHRERGREGGRRRGEKSERRSQQGCPRGKGGKTK